MRILFAGNRITRGQIDYIEENLAKLWPPGIIAPEPPYARNQSVAARAVSKWPKQAATT